jgi:hypothetical protein
LADVDGVGFFDVIHSQRGRPRNGFDLHSATGCNRRLLRGRLRQAPAGRVWRPAGAFAELRSLPNGSVLLRLRSKARFL